MYALIYTDSNGLTMYEGGYDTLAEVRETAETLRACNMLVTIWSN